MSTVALVLFAFGLVTNIAHTIRLSDKIYLLEKRLQRTEHGRMNIMDDPMDSRN